MKKYMFALLGLFVVCASAMAGTSVSDRANVLIIYYDDMGYGDMGANGATGLKIPSDSSYLDPSVPTLTPNLDRFAKQGLRFTNGHSADAVCSPSRYALMTGRYAWRTRLKKGVGGGYSQTLIEADRFTVAKLFQKNGYATAMVGKWHIGMQFYSPSGEPVDLGNKSTVLQGNMIDFSKPLTDTPYHCGFDYYFGTSASLDMPPYAWIESNAKADEVRMLFKGGMVEKETVVFSKARPANNADLVEGPTGEGGRKGARDPSFILADYLQVQARKVSDLIAEFTKQGKPFFIYVPMPAPHEPHAVQEKFKGSAGFTYGDYLVQTDHYTGAILDALGDPVDPDSIAANTVVFITSDNGPETRGFRQGLKVNHDGNGPFSGRKRDSYEGGTRVPFMVRWPGTVQPGTTDHPCWQGDFVATMAEYLGYSLTADEAPDAESFLPILNGKPMPENRRAALIQHSSLGQFAIVDVSGEWKLIDGTGGGGNKRTVDMDNQETLQRGKIRGMPRQLFNLKNDPGERVNLLGDPSSEALAKEQELYDLLNVFRGDKEWGVDGNSNVPRNESNSSN